MESVHNQGSGDSVEEPLLNVRYIYTTVARYRAAITLFLATIAVAYACIALAMLLLSPAATTTSLPFQLNFEGAERGRFPNGVRFSASDMLATPVLEKVYARDGVAQYMPLAEFSRSLFVLESNRDYDRLMIEYQARLSDPRLTPLDRDRLERELDAKRAGLKMNQYTINFTQQSGVQRVPAPVIERALRDILVEWGRYVAQDQHVLEYQTAVLSPGFVTEGSTGAATIVDLHVLRQKIAKIFVNVTKLRALPGAELARTKSDLTFMEINERLTELVRFRLEPLVPAVAALSSSPEADLRFVEAQLAFDERSLQRQKETAAAIKDALVTYLNDKPAAVADSAPGSERKSGTAETVMPQLSEGFLDRIATMARDAGDVEYRQKLVDDYRKVNEMLPAVEGEVAFDQYLLTVLQRRGQSPMTREQVTAQLDATRREAQNLLAAVNELHKVVSRSLNPANDVLTVTAVASTRAVRSVSVFRLVLWGIFLLMVALPVAVVVTLLHAKLTERETEGA